jgi:uncharacterized phage protein (TIGR01671 family)
MSDQLFGMRLRMRVWSHVDKKMWTGGISPNYSDYGLKSVDLLQPDYTHKTYWIGWVDAYEDAKPDPVDAVVMYWSNMFDKNGNPIFEGDILELDEDWAKMIGARRNPVVVGFKDGMFMFGRHGGSPYDMDSVLWMSAAGEMASGKCKVIGNIYENQDLIKPLEPPQEEVAEAQAGIMVCDRCGITASFIPKTSLEELKKHPRKAIAEQKRHFHALGWVTIGPGNDRCPDCAKEEGLNNEPEKEAK